MSSFVASEQSDHFELSNEKYSHQIIGILDSSVNKNKLTAETVFW